MDFDITVLGPVELRVDGKRRLYGVAKEVQLLALLALDASRAVPLDELVNRLWEGSPPLKPRSSLHSYATRLRRRVTAERLVHQAHAYTLAVPPDVVDCHRFQRLTTQARSLAGSGNNTRALELLREAEALWRGAPLTGFTGLWAAQVRHEWEERRLSASLLRCGIELRLNRFDAVVAELASLAESRPTDETVTAHYMTAAYGCGRQGDALEAYEVLRRNLRAEGTEPGEAVRRVHRGILDRLPVDEVSPDRTAATARASAPNNLPAHSGVLTGRTEELTDLLRHAQPGAVAFHSISGMGGVGKSLLALHAARELARLYPSAQLYVNMGAHSGRPPVPPAAALTSLLQSLGIPARSVPRDLDALTTLWRSLLADRRAVVILDDVADAAQVWPLLPGKSSSLVLLTSRRRLTGIPGLRQIFLDVLPQKDAESLFRRLVGAGREYDPADVAELVRLADKLPLAVELLAGRLSSHPTWTAGHLVERMSQRQGRLAEIRNGTSELAVAFALSYDTLPPDQQRVFRLLSLHWTPVFGSHATAALTGLPLARTERLLEQLLDARLLQEPVADRYTMHDLVGAYAHSLMSAEPGPDREEAQDRLAMFYLHAVDRGDRLLNRHRPRLELPLPQPPPELPRWLRTPADTEKHPAAEWLAAEAPAITAAESWLRVRGHAGEAALLAHAAASFLDTEGLWSQAEEMHQHAVMYWRDAGRSKPKARAMLDLAAVQTQTSRYEDAAPTAERALLVARAAADAIGEAEALRALGLVAWNQGRLRDFLSLQQEALEIVSRTRDAWQIARHQNNTGIAHLQLGDRAAAMLHFRESLLGFTHAKDARGEAQALNNLAELYLSTGEQEKAHTAFSRALRLVTQSGSRTEKAIAQLNVGRAMEQPGNAEAALALQRAALDSFRVMNDRRNECVTLNAIGTVLLQDGKYVEAAAHHATALTLAQTISAAQDSLQARYGLGMAELRSGGHEAALEHLNAALAIAREISALEDEARALMGLADLHTSTGDSRTAKQYMRLAYAIAIRLELSEPQPPGKRADRTH